MTHQDQAHFAKLDADQAIRSALKSLTRAADNSDFPLSQAQSLQNCISHCAKALRLITESQFHFTIHNTTK